MACGAPLHENVVCGGVSGRDSLRRAGRRTWMPGPSSQVQVPSSRPESRGGGETKREPGCGGLSSIHCVCPLPVYRRFCAFSRARLRLFAPLLVQHRYGMPRGASLRASALRCNGFTPSLHLDLNMDRSGVSLLRSSARHVQRFLARGQGVQAPGTICYRVGVRCAMAAVASRSIL